MPAQQNFPRLIFGAGVQVAGTDPLANPRWVQIAYEGTFKGYRAGTCTFNRETFAKIIDNFRAHPTFHAGPDGRGDANVVHFDYEHASEMAPTAGTIPVQGAPAPAWVQDLEVREGADGKAQLWAWAKFSQKALAQITADPPEYQWTSVGVWLDAVDSISGSRIGPSLTSVALTNDPFLPGMVPMSVLASRFYSAAESPEQAVVGLREILGLPAMADPSVILANLQRLAELVASGQDPSGVEPIEIVSTIRQLMGLPALSTCDEVIASAMSVLSYDPSAQTAAGSAATGTAETAMELSKRLAATFRVNEQDDLILAAADKAKNASDAMDQLMGILQASDFQSALASAKSLVEKTSGMGELVAQLAAAMDRIGKVDEADAQAETEAVVASRVAQMSLTGAAAKVAADTLRPGILALRKACIDKDPKESERKLAEFRKTYPLPDADRALLTRRVFAGADGTQFTLRADQSGNLHANPMGVAAPPATRADGKSTERLALCQAHEGRNDTEKAMAYLSKERAGFAALDRGAQVHTAGEWLRGNG